MTKPPDRTKAGSAHHGRATRNRTISSQATSDWRPPTQLNNASCDGTACVAVGASSADIFPVGRALYSVDAGESWQIAKLPSGLAALYGVECTSPRHCVAVGDRAIRRPGISPDAVVVSINGGRDWHSVRLPRLAAGGLQALSCGSTEWCVAVSGLEDLITHNGGASWTLHQFPHAVGGISCVAGGFCLAVGNQRGLLNQKAVVMSSSDFGAAWQVVWHATAMPAVQDLDDVDCLSSSHCLLSAGVSRGCPPYCNGIMLDTSDGGTSWTRAKQTDGRGGGGVGAGSIACASRAFCIASGGLPPNLSGTVFEVTSDGGHRWRSPGQEGLLLKDVYGEQSGNPLSGGVACSSADSCIDVGNNSGFPSGIFVGRTVDEGSTWRAVVLPPCALGRCRK